MPPTPTNFSQLVDVFFELLVTALPVIVGLAFLVFFWGLVKFIFRIGGDERAVAEGKKFMVWGLIALFIIVSFWAILAFAYGEFGFTRPFDWPLLPE